MECGVLWVSYKVIPSTESAPVRLILSVGVGDINSTADGGGLSVDPTVATATAVMTRFSACIAAGLCRDWRVA